jgi:hypothetical protein
LNASGAGHGRLLAGIVGAGLLLRLALAVFVAPYPERFIQADAIGYDRLALNLAAGHGFSLREAEPYTPDNLRTPGYPLTVAAVYAAFGHRPDLVLLLQAVMGALTVGLAYGLGRLLGGAGAGLGAAALLAASPLPITYSAVLWAETEYTLAFTLSLILSLLMLRNRQPGWVIAGAVAAGLAALIHPRSVYVPYLFALALAAGGLALWRRRFPGEAGAAAARPGLGAALARAGLYLLVFQLVLLPWRLRNAAVFGVANLTSGAGLNLLQYGAALAEASQTGEDQWAITRRYEAEVKALSPTPLNEAQFYELAWDLALQKIAGNPAAYARVHLAGMARTLLPGTLTLNNLLTGRTGFDVGQVYALLVTPGQIGRLGEALAGYPAGVWAVLLFEMASLAAIYGFSLAGLAWGGRGRPWAWLVAAVLVYLAAVAGPAGAPRFRVVMMPLFSALAALGLSASAPALARAGLGWRGRRLRPAAQPLPILAQRDER